MMKKEIVDACMEMGWNSNGWDRMVSPDGIHPGKTEKTVLVLKEEKNWKEATLQAAGEAEHLIVSQSVFENHLLYHGRSGIQVRMPRVRTLQLLPEKEKVSLFFLPKLAEMLPELKLVCIEGDEMITLSLDRDERIAGYSFMVLSRKVKRVTQFYAEAERGETALLCLPGIDPANVCRPYRVRLMIPYFEHPEWYGQEDKERYSGWLQHNARAFFLQAMEEHHGELLEKSLLEEGRPGMRPETCKSLEDGARRMGYEALALRLEETGRKRLQGMIR